MSILLARVLPFFSVDSGDFLTFAMESGSFQYLPMKNGEFP